MKKLTLFKLSALTALGLIATASSASAQRTTIFFGCGFTQTAQNAAGGNSNIRANINAGVRNTNRALNPSQTSARLRGRSYALFPNYSEAGKDVGSALGDWRRRRSIIGNTAAGQTQLQFENQIRADFMMLIVKAGGGGGNGQATPDSGYSCILQGRATQPTFPHEIGHNVSALHSHANTMAKTPQNRLPRTQVTLLGSAGRGYSDVAPRYSNPNVRYRRARTGVAGSRENALRIFRSRVARAAIR